MSGATSIISLLGELLTAVPVSLQASEAFLQRMTALFVASHYRNTPNDLILMSDAPAHNLFALVGPVDETQVPDCGRSPLDVHCRRNNIRTVPGMLIPGRGTMTGVCEQCRMRCQTSCAWRKSHWRALSPRRLHLPAWQRAPCQR